MNPDPDQTKVLDALNAVVTLLLSGATVDEMAAGLKPIEANFAEGMQQMNVQVLQELLGRSDLEKYHVVLYGYLSSGFTRSAYANKREMA